MARILNLYIVESRFQALVALMVARSQPEHEHRLFYFLESIGDFTRQFPFVESVFLGHRLRKGLWKKPRSLRRMVNTVVDVALQGEPPTTVHYHCANLKTPLLNYPLHALKQALPNALLTVNILTDGTSNFKRRHLSEKAQRKLRKIAQRPIPLLLGLRFTLFNRERFGIDADIIDKIYLLPGAPHQYDLSKVVDMPIVDLGLPAAHANDETRALVIGEKLTERNWLAPEDEQRIALQLAELIAATGITHIDYVPHPTATHLDLWQDHYTRVDTKDPIELRIMQHRYPLICGIASTALFTARLLQPADGRTISAGLQCVTGRNALASTIGQAFNGMGVECV
jgi:hypothetical protein